MIYRNTGYYDNNYTCNKEGERRKYICCKILGGIVISHPSNETKMPTKFVSNENNFICNVIVFKQSF